MSTSTTTDPSTPTASIDPINPTNKFKKQNVIGSTSKAKKSQWKSLKQIVTTDRMLPWGDAVTYSSLNPPPSFRPAKKYSDVSGLIACYTEPESKLRYHSPEEYQIVKNLPSDLSAGYLSLRGASNVVG